MKKLIALAIAMVLSTGMVFAQGSVADALADECTGNFEAEVFCPTVVECVTDAWYHLGSFPADGNEYTPNAYGTLLNGTAFGDVHTWNVKGQTNFSYQLAGTFNSAFDATNGYESNEGDVWIKSFTWSDAAADLAINVPLQETAWYLQDGSETATPACTQEQIDLDVNGVMAETTAAIGYHTWDVTLTATVNL